MKVLGFMILDEVIIEGMILDIGWNLFFFGVIRFVVVVIFLRLLVSMMMFLLLRNGWFFWKVFISCLYFLVLE